MAGSGWVVFAAVLVAVVAVDGHEDAATMATECSADFQKVVGCMNFATGKATVPSKECCASVTEMRANSPKCMCFIIQQSKNGSEQIKSLGIRTDKLLQLPIACELKNTSVSECPKLLGLAANSTDAAIFTSPTSSPSAPSGTTASKATPTAATKADEASGAMELRPHFMAIGVAVFLSAAVLGTSSSQMCTKFGA